MNERQVKQNLMDAGCHEAVITDIMQLMKSGRSQDALYMMKKDRCRLMEELHACGRKVDCLDFLIRQMTKEIRGGES